MRQGESAAPGRGTVSVVVPVYFNEQSLPILFDALLEVEAGLRERDLELELIFVDDGSRDGSFADLREAQGRRPATCLVKLSRNFGAVHASKTGMRFVTGDCFLVLAADLQDPPALIVEMVRAVAGRVRSSSPASARTVRPAADMLLRQACTTASSGPGRDPTYPDGGYDLALMEPGDAPHMQTSGKNINPNVFAFWLGFEPDVIPYAGASGLHGKSRWTFRKRLKFFLDSMLGFSIVPLRLMSLTGVVVSLASLAFVAVVVINGLLRPARACPAFATLVVDHLVSARRS